MMPEPTSSGAAGYGAAKIAIAFGLPAMAVAFVVMVMTEPRSRKEWAVGLICTVASSLFLGAAVVNHYDLHYLVNDNFGLLELGGIIFSCGLPGWVVVRSFFTWFEKRKTMDTEEMASDAVDGVKKVKDKLKDLL